MDQDYACLTSTIAVKCKNKHLKCFICNNLDLPNKKNWKKHQKNEEHIMRLRFYAKNFVDYPGNIVRCKLCASNIPKDSFIKHAEDHRLIPWYMPDEDELYFENFIAPIKSQKKDHSIYCHLCRAVIDKSKLMTHISGLCHWQMLGNLQKYVNSKNISSELRKKLIANSIFPFNSTKLRCYLCESVIDDNEDLKKHIESQLHCENLTKIHENVLINSRSVPIIDTETQKNRKITSTSEEPFPKFFDNFITKRTDDYYCNLCKNDYPSLNLILKHIEDPVHCNLFIHERRSQSILADTTFSAEFCEKLVKNNIFKYEGLQLRCYTCEIIVPDSVQDHIDSHRDNCKCNSDLDEEKSVDTSEVITVTNESQTVCEPDKFLTLFVNFIEKRDEIYYCHLCKFDLSSISEVMTHISDSTHENLIINRRINERITHEIEPKFNNYEILVKKGIFQLKPGIMKCYACGCLLKMFSEYKAQKHSCQPKNKAKVSAKQNDENKFKTKQKYPDFIRINSTHDDEKILTCYICSITELWKNHKKDREHFLKIKFFYDHFIDDRYDQVLCKDCGIYIPKKAVIDHATDEHQLIPWFRPPDEHVTFFKNSIIPLGYKFYCCLCKQSLNTRWFGALAHCQNKKHLKAIEIKDEDINLEDLSYDYCEKLSANSIFPINFTQLRCWACDYVIDGYENGYKHIKDHKIKFRRIKNEISFSRR